jgi:DNA-binding transcriptional regulator YiaG
LTRIHPQARTTPLVRAEITASQEPIAELARRYNITKATVRNWKGREAPEVATF